MKISKYLEPPERFMWWHWQNLNDRKPHSEENPGLPIRGRCWWHFRKNRTVNFEWNLWGRSFRLGFDIDDEDLTFALALPPVSLYLSFSSTWKWVNRLAPKKVLDSVHYPNTIVIDERECQIAIHGNRLWINPWSKRGEWVKKDPWWERGVSFLINPFEWKHTGHDVRRSDGTWAPYVGCWERDKTPDGREEFTYPYRYVLNNGTVQERTATIFVDRRKWRPLCLRWTSLFERVETCIDVKFSEEVGERSGSWKGGCIGCGYELRPNETPLQCLRRMEAERKF